MCTAVTYHTKDHYFGRNLDLEYSYNESVTVTPRNYPFHFRREAPLEQHYAMIGMAYVLDDYPLYYDGVNEKGLAMAGLNFPDNAVYYEEAAGLNNVTPFELIPWILGQCASVSEAREKLDKLNLVNINYSEQLPLSPLHWMIADKEESITVEAVAEGLKVYENSVGVLTNNPPFDYMMSNLANYRHLSASLSQNRLAEGLNIPTYSRGMAAIGLPGDYSSASRFVKVTFAKWNAVSGESENESVSQFFHILGSVEMPRGCVVLGEDVYAVTVYSSCMNQDRGIYYYVTYENRQIQGVDMYREDLDGSELKSYPLRKEQAILFAQ